MQEKIGNRLIDSIVPRAKPFEVRDTEIKGFVVRVQPSGVKTYLCDFRLPNGRRNRITIGRSAVITPTQARDEAKRILGSLAMGQDPVAARQRAKEHTLDTFLTQQYEPWVTTHRKGGKDTVALIQSRFPDLKTRRLSEIAPWLIEKWRSERLKNKIKPATVNRNIAALKAVLSKAVEWGILESNPLSTVRPCRVDSSAKVRFLSEEEEGRLRDSLSQRETRIRNSRIQSNNWRRERGYDEFPDFRMTTFVDHLKPMVLISINTGLRQGELFGLQWSEIDFPSETITISGAKAKSGKTRHIPMNSEVKLVLQAWYAQNNSTTSLVFPNRDRLRINNVKRSWGNVLLDAAISNFRWHDMRHHFASRLVMAGVDLNTVRELLGHSDIKMTLRYAHLSPRIKAEAVSRLTRPNLGNERAEIAEEQTA